MQKSMLRKATKLEKTKQNRNKKKKSNDEAIDAEYEVKG
jgi:hypothetical protein